MKWINIAINALSASQSWSSYWATRTITIGTVTILSDTSLTVTHANNGTLDYTGHKYYVSIDNINFTLNKTVATIGTSATLTGLNSNTLYYVKVAPYKNSNIGTLSSAASGTTITLPSDLSGLDLWVYPDDIDGNDGDEVASYISKDTGARQFDAAATKRPLLKKGSNGLNGHNTLRFDGSNDILICTTAFLTSTQGTVIYISTLNAALQNNQAMLASSDESTAGTYYLTCYDFKTVATQQNPRIIQRNNDTADDIKSTNAGVVGVPYRRYFMSNGSTYRMRTNDLEMAITVSAGTNTGDWFGDVLNRDNVTIGGIKINSETQFFRGDLAEMIVYNRQIDSTELTKINNYLIYRYNYSVMMTLGDSITAGIAASTEVNRWANIVANTKGWVLDNRGVSGTLCQNSTQSAISTIGAASDNNGRDIYTGLVSTRSPDHVFIMYGVNDLRLNDANITVASFQNDLGEIVDGIVAMGLSVNRIVIGSPPYISTYVHASPWDAGSMAKHQQYIAAAAAVASAKGTKYVDIYQHMYDNGREALLDDGVHPNDAGHAAIAAAFLSVL